MHIINVNYMNKRKRKFINVKYCQFYFFTKKEKKLILCDTHAAYAISKSIRNEVARGDHIFFLWLKLYISWWCNAKIHINKEIKEHVTCPKMSSLRTMYKFNRLSKNLGFNTRNLNNFLKKLACIYCLVIWFVKFNQL